MELAQDRTPRELLDEGRLSGEGQAREGHQAVLGRHELEEALAPDRRLVAGLPKPEIPGLEGLVADLASHEGLDVIELEAVGFMGHKHGSHHDKSSFASEPFTDFLLSYCFCDDCMQGLGTGAEAIRDNLFTRSTWYMGGDEDTAISSSLDTSCSGNLQGENRYERYQNYRDYADRFDRWSGASFQSVPGVGHSSRQMLASEAVRQVVFRLPAGHGPGDFLPAPVLLSADASR